MDSPIIETKKLTVVYRKGQPSEHYALKEVSLKVFPQEFLVIFGPSGCGKSTLLYAISGIEKNVDKGEIWIKGKNLVGMTKEELTVFHRTDVGMIFQAHYLIPTLDVLSNVTMPLTFHGVDRKVRVEQGQKLLSHFGIENFSRKMPSELSGGQQQRVGIARALINDPDIVLADEPTGNLDSVSALNVLNTLQELNQKYKKTVILVTHEPQHLPYATRVIYMKDGRIVDEITQKPRALGELKPADGSNLAMHMEVYSGKIINYMGFQLKTDEHTRLTQAVTDFLERKITRVDLIKALDTPFKKGGVGMYRQKAERLVHELEEILEVNSILKTIASDTEDIAEVKFKFITEWLLKAYHGSLSEEQKKRIHQFVVDRIKGKLNQAQMLEILDRNEAKGGAGLNWHTARNITERLEIAV